VIGLLPAWQFGKTNAGDALATGLRSTAGLRSGRVRSLLVSLEVALSAACLIASGLLLHSLVNLLDIDRGFGAQHIITVELNLPPSRYPTPEKRAEFVRSALDRLKTLPGATAVAVTNKLALTGDLQLPLSGFRTMDDVVEESVSQRRFQTNLVLLFAVAAILLVGLGVYGVLSCAITQRTTEIGTRRALGPDGRVVLRMVLRQALGPVALSLAVGVPLALPIGSTLRSMLFGVSPHDPATIVPACLVLVTVALVATYLPARRASNVDPLIALRYE